jgi:hypothetical protein
MDASSNCKGCSRTVKVPSEDIQKMIDEIKSSEDFKLVSEEEYKKRIEQCSSCKYFGFGTTCSQCGCIVQVRALLKDKDCPHPKKSMW